MPHPAAHFDRLAKDAVRCRLCPHECVILPGERGDCLTRRNEDGSLVAETYGMLAAAAVDPIEKKPLAHYRPGTRTFSVASAGCNLTCPFCQNHGLSQCLRDTPSLGRTASEHSPEEIVNAAIDNRCESIAFTYSEPVLSFELARDVGRLARPEGIELVFVTNGQVNAVPGRELSGFLAAANVDLKCFDADAYRDVLGGSLEAVLRTIESFHAAGVWLEVTTLVIPGFNDDDEQLARIAGFVAGIDPRIPWHVSRFHPAYHWSDRRPTPIDTLERTRRIGVEAGLKYVYIGNSPGHEGEKTRCPGCGEVVVDRSGYMVRELRTRDGRCPSCGAEIAGVGFP
ncbi:MAG: AmmeMemoRadiSam system radical SAM enzyme [Polyangia bacterium]